MTGPDLAEQGLQGFHLAHIGSDELGLGSAHRGQAVRGLASAHHHPRTRRQETAGDARADALGAPGD